MKFTKNGDNPAMPLEVRESALTEPAGEGSWKNLAVPSIQQSPVVVVLSEDNGLTQLVGSIIRSPWRLESCRYGDGLAGLQRLHDVRLAIIDDQAVAERERGWLLTQVHKHLPGATLLYVAGVHTAENERRARANGAGYYTARPIQNDRLGCVLKAFMHQLA
jgi:hypothetical protein